MALTSAQRMDLKSKSAKARGTAGVYTIDCYIFYGTVFKIVDYFYAFNGFNK